MQKEIVAIINIEHLYKQKRIASKGSSDYIKRMIAYKMAESDLNRHLVYCQKAHKTNS